MSLLFKYESKYISQCLYTKSFLQKVKNKIISPINDILCRCLIEANVNIYPAKYRLASRGVSRENHHASEKILCGLLNFSFICIIRVPVPRSRTPSIYSRARIYSFARIQATWRSGFCIAGQLRPRRRYHSGRAHIVPEQAAALFRDFAGERSRYDRTWGSVSRARRRSTRSFQIPRKNCCNLRCCKL